ncbi:unnamed protein product [Orchesella dallaii]|uniref:Vitelline membrane outer layer protein 1 n=1 Tax=Orchesella dallaii TaxID=48710 RepID=A0ABP1RJ59_9HEXA
MEHNNKYLLPLLTLLVVFISGATSENLNITSPLITNWGVWGYFEKCPDGLAVQGFQLKTQRFIGILGDDTAVNGLNLFCGDPRNQSTTVISSNSGSKGEYGSIYSCFPGYINGFQLRVETNQGNGDDTATNNIRVYCSNEPDPTRYVEGDGLNFGIWSEARWCFSTQRICGIQTQVEDCSGTDDCTSLNNILTECCDIELP